MQTRQWRLPQRCVRVLGACLEGGGDAGEEVETGPGFDVGNRGAELRGVIIDAAVRLIGVDVCHALSSGDGASEDGATHQQFIEMAGPADSTAVIAAAGIVRLEEDAGNHVKGIAGSGWSIALYRLFERRPYTRIEAVLPLGTLVGIVEGLLVGFFHRLAVCRSTHVPTGITVSPL